MAATYALITSPNLSGTKSNAVYIYVSRAQPEKQQIRLCTCAHRPTCLGAGTDLLFQQRNGARSQTALANTHPLATQSKTKDFIIQVQPAKNLDDCILFLPAYRRTSLFLF